MRVEIGAPTGTPRPSIDPDRAPCELTADIDCSTASGRSCRRISSPTDSVCNDGSGATAVEFLMTGSSCGNTPNCDQVSGSNIAVPNVFVTVQDGGVTVFANVVALGEIFRVLGPFDQSSLAITVSANVNGQAGATLQILQSVELGCDGTFGQDLTLLRDYGSLQLVGFSSASQGTQSIIETFSLTMTIANDGSTIATVLEATGGSPFEPGPINFIPGGPTDLQSGQALTAETLAVLNLAESQGSEFQFDVSTSGVNSANGLDCQGIARYIIRVD